LNFDILPPASRLTSRKNSLFAAQKYFFMPEKTLIPSLQCFQSDPFGVAGREYLPLSVSKGPAFPFPLTLDGFSTSPADFAQGQWSSSDYMGDFSTETPQHPMISRSELVFPFLANKTNQTNTTNQLIGIWILTFHP
jgi:hypothetical protein